MKTSNPLCAHAVRLALGLLLPAVAGTVIAAPLLVSEIPLFVASGLKPNVLLTVANSNSMDEDATGLAVGSDKPNSKSEIARRVAKNLVLNYGSGLNMGLMAFQQNPPALRYLHSAAYDASFVSANYDPTYTGGRDSPTKKFREPNASWPGNFIYYNVNLPFYSGGNEGVAFCYSATADAFNNGENVVSPPYPPPGPWDYYACYSSKQTQSEILPSTWTQRSGSGAPGWAPAANELAQGWSGRKSINWYFTTDSDLGQGISDFGRFMTWRYVSRAWFDGGSPGAGYLHVPIAPVNATQATKMNIKLGTSELFGPSHHTNSGKPLSNSGLTPLIGTLYTIRDYFAGNLTSTAQGGGSPAPVPPNSCGKNYSVLLTNGLPSVLRFGTASTDVTTMLADATTAAAALYGAGPPTGVLNYVVGFALPFGVNSAQLDTIAAAGGTGTAYNADDEDELTLALNAVFNDILIRSGAAGAVALNSGYAQANLKVFQAKFNTGDWSGQLLAFPIDPITGAIGTQMWDAGAKVNAQNWNTGRRIITYNPDSNRGVPFRWPAVPAAPTADELSPAQVLALNTNHLGVVDPPATPLGDTRLTYLRGDPSNEGSGGSNFRVRSVSKLGDIVNSSPVFVDKPSKSLSDPSYIAFKNTYATRSPMLYVGANDGMLHGFRAVDGVTGGEELLAFVPSPVYSRLSGLTAQGFNHKYLVDGGPIAADIKLSVGWRTILVGGLGGGGRGLYALNVTDPAGFNEASANSIALWEFTSDDDPDLGLTYSQSTIIKMNNGQPGVIVGNGYNNLGSGLAKLFVLNAETGAVMAEIATSGGTVLNPNGLSTPAVVDTDGNGTADYAFAGDLFGNVWKFNLTSTSAGSWNVAYGGTPLYVARDGGGTRQPITTGLEVTRHPDGGYMVMFGTGQYIQTADVGSTAVQSTYGIRDNGAIVVGRGNLQQQSVIETRTDTGKLYRAVTQNNVNYSTQSGWYLDLPTTGERVVVDPILRDGRFVFTTAIPNTNPCADGGVSWLMETDYISGGRLNINVFDVNGDGIIDASDTVPFAGTPQASGVQLTGGMGSSPSVVGGLGEDGDIEVKNINKTDGTLETVREPFSTLSTRRTSWRQIL